MIPLETNDDIRAFLDVLLKVAGENGKYHDELYSIQHTCFTTSSEYLGELKILLVKLRRECTYFKYIHELDELILKINNAFSKSNQI